MTSQQMQLQGYLITEKEILKLEELIFSQYQEAQKLIDQKLQKLWAQMADIPKDKRFNWVIQYDRLNKIKKEINSIYTAYDMKAYRNTASAGRLAISNTYYRQLYTLSWQSPLEFGMIPDNLIEYAVTGQVEKWNELSVVAKQKYVDSGLWAPKGTLLQTFQKNRADTVLKIQQQINAGIMVGDSYAKVARRVAETIGKVTKDTVTGQLANAARIVRTEGNRLQNAGSLAASYEAREQGIDIRKAWDATLDGKTRPSHGSADGQERELEEAFTVDGEALQYPGDSAGSAGNVIRCRCVKVDRVGDWKPLSRRGRNPVTGKYEIMDYQSFGDWADRHGLVENQYGQLYNA